MVLYIQTSMQTIHTMSHTLSPVIHQVALQLQYQNVAFQDVLWMTYLLKSASLHTCSSGKQNEHMVDIAEH